MVRVFRFPSLWLGWLVMSLSVLVVYFFMGLNVYYLCTKGVPPLFVLVNRFSFIYLKNKEIKK